LKFEQGDHKPAGVQRSGTLGRWFRRTALVVAVALVLSEAALRLVIGLGDPPLYEVHPTIEYLMKRGVYRRFGNLVSVNSAGMRSPESVVAPPAPGTRRVLVVGDSIVNGGSLTDDSALATASLAVQLSVSTPTSVCNISAGSWGPGNWLAFFKERGTFSASFAVLVLNDGDATDAPTFAPLGPEHPTAAPLLASWEVLSNYLPRYVPWLRPAPPIASSARVVDPLDDLSDGIQLLRKSGVATCAVLTPTESELSAGPGKGLLAIRARLESLGVPFVDASGLLRSAVNRGEAPFRDGVHLTSEGQTLLAEACREALGMIGASDQPPGSSAVP
jgi:hypothetical protein